MKKLEKMRGITLIALIVTIIILLILAGISIQLIGGSNGILKRASEALDANDKATATEKMELKITYLNMISYGENTRKATLQELADGLFADKEIEYVKLKNQEVATLQPIDVTGESSFFVKLKEYAYEFEIDENLQLASVDGVKLSNSDNNELNVRIEELKLAVEKLQEKDKALEDKVQFLQADNDNLKTKIERLENEGILNKRVKLLDNFVEIPLSTTPVNQNVDIELSDSTENYKYLEIQYDINRGNVSEYAMEKTIFLAVEQLSYNNSNNFSYNNSIFQLTYGNGQEGSYVSLWLKDEQKLHVENCVTSNNGRKKFRIRNIYGIQ